MSEITQLVNDIDAWAEREIMCDEGIPDFWGELDTSDRLADFLFSIGYRKQQSGLRQLELDEQPVAKEPVGLTPEMFAEHREPGGPAFIMACNSDCDGMCLCGRLPIDGYIWQAATEWTGAGWVRPKGKFIEYRTTKGSAIRKGS